MTIEVNREMLPNVLDRLMSFFPYSLWIHGAIRNIEMCPSDRSQIYVDKWPEFECITIRPCPEITTGQVPVLDFERKLFSTNLESVRSLLLKLPFFDGHERTDFTACRSLIWPAIEDRAKQCGFDTDVESARCQMYYLPDNTVLPAGPDLPSGYRVDQLQRLHAVTVNSVWAYNLGEKTERYIQGLIDNFPSVGVFQEDSEELVAFAISYEDGAMGNLYVHPDHRRKGLGTFSICYLIRQVRQRGSTPFVYIVPENDTSILLHEKLGFVCTNEGMSWVCCTRKMLTN